jgi:hypothetical protein
MQSVETKFAEAMVALKKANRVSKFNEVSKTCTTIESKLVAAEAVLAEKGIVREAIRKNNGAGDNFVEGNPLGRTVEELRENSFSAGYIKETTNLCAKGDKVLFDGLLKLGKITEAEHTKLTGQKPQGYTELTEQQRKDFDFARLIGISEADAFKVAKIASTNFKEVSR